MEKQIGVLVELDYCVGCYTCQSACQNYNNLPLKETYLRCLIMKPEFVNGDYVSFMCPIPYNLEGCVICMEREGGAAPCTKTCIGRALHISDMEAIIEKSRNSRSKVAVFF